jgi:hypothetical protein
MQKNKCCKYGTIKTIKVCKILNAHTLNLTLDIQQLIIKREVAYIDQLKKEGKN